MVSAVIITQNESSNIVGCITSLEGFVDEIIVLDAGSTDQTPELAQQHGAKVIISEWKGYGAARNYAADLAQHDWIISIDADERIVKNDTQLLSETNLDPGIIYQIRRNNFIGKRKIRFGWFGPEWKNRLYNRKHAKWNLRKVHEELTTFSDHQLLRKTGITIDHLAYDNIEQCNQQLDLYAKLTALEWKEQNLQKARVTRILSPYWYFVKAFFMKAGFLEGKMGMQLAYSAFKYSKLKYKYFEEKD